MVNNFNTSFLLDWLNPPYRYAETINVIIVFSDNLTPSELKKLKNKQRKQQKKLEKEKEKQKELEKKDHTNKKQQDQDQDGPKEEELVPDKLAKVSAVIFFIFAGLKIAGCGS